MIACVTCEISISLSISRVSQRMKAFVHCLSHFIHIIMIVQKYELKEMSRENSNNSYLATAFAYELYPSEYCTVIIMG